VRRSTLDAYASSDRVAELAKDAVPSAGYPDTELANRLELVARLIKGGYESRVFYTSQGGYDTDPQQLGVHMGPLGELSGALKAFFDEWLGLPSGLALGETFEPLSLFKVRVKRGP
jgi:hypothetical protein